MVKEKMQTGVKGTCSQMFEKGLMGKFRLLLGTPINSEEREKMIGFICNLEQLQI